MSINASTQRELSSYRVICIFVPELEHNGSGSAFGFCMTSVVAIHLLTYMLRIYQLIASYLHFFPELEVGSLGSLLPTPMCHCVTVFVLIILI